MTDRGNDHEDDLHLPPEGDLSDILGDATSTSTERQHPDLESPSDEPFEMAPGPDDEGGFDVDPRAVVPDGTGRLTVPSEHYEQFVETETELYELALDVYRDALEAPDTKTRLKAAKEVTTIFTARRDAADRREHGDTAATNNTQINIGVDSVKEALKAALYGMRGGMEETTDAKRNERYVARPDAGRGHDRRNERLSGTASAPDGDGNIPDRFSSPGTKGTSQK